MKLTTTQNSSKNLVTRIHTMPTPPHKRLNNPGTKDNISRTFTLPVKGNLIGDDNNIVIDNPDLKNTATELEEKNKHECISITCGDKNSGMADKRGDRDKGEYGNNVMRGENNNDNRDVLGQLRIDNEIHQNVGMNEMQSINNEEIISPNKDFEIIKGVLDDLMSGTNECDINDSVSCKGVMDDEQPSSGLDDIFYNIGGTKECTDSNKDQKHKNANIFQNEDNKFNANNDSPKEMPVTNASHLVIENKDYKRETAHDTYPICSEFELDQKHITSNSNFINSNKTYENKGVCNYKAAFTNASNFISEQSDVKNRATKKEPTTQSKKGIKSENGLVKCEESFIDLLSGKNNMETNKSQKNNRHAIRNNTAVEMIGKTIDMIGTHCENKKENSETSNKTSAGDIESETLFKTNAKQERMLYEDKQGSHERKDNSNVVYGVGLNKIENTTRGGLLHNEGNNVHKNVPEDCKSNVNNNKHNYGSFNNNEGIGFLEADPEIADIFLDDDEKSHNNKNGYFGSDSSDLTPTKSNKCFLEDSFEEILPQRYNREKTSDQINDKNNPNNSEKISTEGFIDGMLDKYPEDPYFDDINPDELNPNDINPNDLYPDKIQKSNKGSTRITKNSKPAVKTSSDNKHSRSSFDHDINTLPDLETIQAQSLNMHFSPKNEFLDTSNKQINKGMEQTGTEITDANLLLDAKDEEDDFDRIFEAEFEAVMKEDADKPQGKKNVKQGPTEQDKNMKSIEISDYIKQKSINNRINTANTFLGVDKNRFAQYENDDISSPKGEGPKREGNIIREKEKDNIREVTINKHEERHEIIPVDEEEYQEIYPDECDDEHYVMVQGGEQFQNIAPMQMYANDKPKQGKLIHEYKRMQDYCTHPTQRSHIFYVQSIERQNALDQLAREMYRIPESAMPEIINEKQVYDPRMAINEGKYHLDEVEYTKAMRGNAANMQMYGQFTENVEHARAMHEKANNQQMYGNYANDMAYVKTIREKAANVRMYGNSIGYPGNQVPIQSHMTHNTFVRRNRMEVAEHMQHRDPNAKKNYPSHAYKSSYTHMAHKGEIDSLNKRLAYINQANIQMANNAQKYKSHSFPPGSNKRYKMSNDDNANSNRQRSAHIMDGSSGQPRQNHRQPSVPRQNNAIYNQKAQYTGPSSQPHPQGQVYAHQNMHAQHIQQYPPQHHPQAQQYPHPHSHPNPHVQPNPHPHPNPHQQSQHYPQHPGMHANAYAHNPNINPNMHVQNPNVNARNFNARNVNAQNIHAQNIHAQNMHAQNIHARNKNIHNPQQQRINPSNRSHVYNNDPRINFNSHIHNPYMSQNQPNKNNPHNPHNNTDNNLHTNKNISYNNTGNTNKNMKTNSPRVGAKTYTNSPGFCQQGPVTRGQHPNGYQQNINYVQKNIPSNPHTGRHQNYVDNKMPHRSANGRMPQIDMNTNNAMKKKNSIDDMSHSIDGYSSSVDKRMHDSTMTQEPKNVKSGGINLNIIRHGPGSNLTCKFDNVYSNFNNQNKEEHLNVDIENIESLPTTQTNELQQTSSKSSNVTNNPDMKRRITSNSLFPHNSSYYTVDQDSKQMERLNNRIFEMNYAPLDLPIEEIVLVKARINNSKAMFEKLNYLLSSESVDPSITRINNILSLQKEAFEKEIYFLRQKDIDSMIEEINKMEETKRRENPNEKPLEYNFNNNGFIWASKKIAKNFENMKSKNKEFELKLGEKKEFDDEVEANFDYNVDFDDL